MIKDCSNIEIAALEIFVSDSMSSGKGVVLTSAVSTKIHNCYIHGNPVYGIALYYATKTVIEQNTFMTDEEFLETITWKDGTTSLRPWNVGIDRLEEDTTIRDNVFENLNYAIRNNYSCNNALIVNNIFRYTYVGIMTSIYNQASLYGSIIVDGNYCEGCYTYDTMASSFQNPAMGFRFEASNSGVAESIEKFQVIVTNNRLSNVTTGIRVDGVTDSIISNNIINCSYEGSQPYTGLTGVHIGSYTTSKRVLVSNNVTNGQIIGGSNATIVNNVTED